MINFRCPECNKTLAVREGSAGHIVCPKCSVRFELSARLSGTASSESPGQPKALSENTTRRAKHNSRFRIGCILTAGGIFVVTIFFLATCILAFWPGLGRKKPGVDQEHAKHAVQQDELENAKPIDNGSLPPDEVEPKKILPVEGTRKTRGGRPIEIPFDAVATMERLEEVKAVRIKGKSRFVNTLNINDVVITWESLKRLKFEETGRNYDSSMVLIRDFGWSVKNNEVLSMEGDGLAFYQNFNYAMILSNLIPLIEDGFEVEKGDDVEVREKKCFTASVRRAGRPPMKLYFDKATRLLYKAEFKGNFLNENNQFALVATFVEVFFSDYRVTDGINHWRKYEQWRDGKRFAEIDVNEVTFFKKIDDSLFSVPSLEQKIQEVLASYKERDQKELISSTARLSFLT